MFSISFIFVPEHVKEFEMRTKGESTSLGQPYDFQSIMHYSNKAFSRNGGDTIQSKADPTMKLGNENSLSAVDVLQINLLYRCPEALKQGTCAIERSDGDRKLISVGEFPLTFLFTFYLVRTRFCGAMRKLEFTIRPTNLDCVFI